MKVLPLFPLLFLLAKTGFTQTFLPVSGPVMEQELAFNQANESYLFFNNLSGDTLQLRWRSLGVDMPGDWVADLCDYGLCYTGIPSTGTMNPVFDIQPYLKLIVQPGTTAGSGWIWFRVFEKDHEDNYVDVFFSLFTTGTTSAGEPESVSMKFFPNPARNFLFLENNGPEEQHARLLNASGEEFREQAVPAGEQKQLEVGTLPDGVYFLQTDKSRVQKVIIQR